MTERDHPRTRPEGQTTGSPQRPAQRVSASVLQFNLADEARQLRAEEAWRRGDRNAKTLVKEHDLRVVLTALKAGARVEQHATPGRLTIQVTSGRVRVSLGSESTDLFEHELIALERGVPHEVEALDESDFLLTIAWPEGSA
jgi:quercetin dioxygenase-like cupin family protein